MDSSFLKSQHPVVEELLTNKYFGDTLLVCANGHLTDNKLAVGLLFPSLLTSDIFALPIENVLLVPDYTMEEIGREFEKLLLQTFQQLDTSSVPSVPILVVDDDDEVQDLVIDESHIESCEPSTSQGPPQPDFVVEPSPSVETRTPASTSGGLDVENGFVENCDNIHIGGTTGNSIQIFIKDDPLLPDVQVTADENLNTDYCMEDEGGGGGGGGEGEGGGDYGEPYLISGEEEDDGPPDISYYPHYSSARTSPLVDDSRNNTDGDIPVLKPERSKKAVSFSPGFKKTVTFSPANTRTVTFSPINSKAVTFSPANKKTVTFSPDVSEKIHRRPRLRHPRLKLTVVDDSQEVIQNLPGLPDTLPQSNDSTARRSPKKESPVLENRKPGRPKTRPELPGLLKKKPENGITRFKQKSAEWKAAEVFKCGVCNKVLSCRGSYERHTRMHQDSKPYKCSYCPKTFVEACKKAVHERVHSGSKPFPCQQCNKSFRTATQRNVHIRSHTKERPYSCEVCGKVFSQPYSVKVHKEKFHNK